MGCLEHTQQSRGLGISGFQAHCGADGMRAPVVTAAADMCLAIGVSNTAYTGYKIHSTSVKSAKSCRRRMKRTAKQQQATVSKRRQGVVLPRRWPCSTPCNDRRCGLCARACAQTLLQVIRRGLRAQHVPMGVSPAALAAAARACAPRLPQPTMHNQVCRNLSKLTLFSDLPACMRQGVYTGATPADRVTQRRPPADPGAAAAAATASSKCTSEWKVSVRLRSQPTVAVWPQATTMPRAVAA
jgi:hypothetical protein